MERYMDTALPAGERARDLLSRLSTGEKLKQLIGAFPRPGNEKALDAAVAGGIGQYSMLEMRRLGSLDEAAKWQRDLQQKAMAASPHHIPAAFHMEGLCGAYVQGATSYPAGIARGASFDPDLEREIAQVVARQERAVGVTQIFAPVLDISRDSRMGRQGESYGEDPALAAAMGAAFTAGIQADDTDGRRAESVAKHFLGFHHSQGGIHGADAEIPPRLLREVYAKSFQAAITQSGLRGVMPCYCTLNGKAVSASRDILTGLLREEMGFDGVAVSDYGAMSNVHNTQHQFESMTETGLKCLEAGMDVELPTRDTLTEELADWFDDGRADVAVLDRAVLRVLEAKFRMGLFEHPFALEGEDLKRAFHSENDRSLSLRSAREGMVLLKNDGALPISRSAKKIAVIGCHAVNPRYYFGGYTHLSMVEAILAVEGSMAGVRQEGPVTDYERVPGTQIQVNETPEFDAVLDRLCPGCPSLLEELKARLPDREIVWAYGYPCAGDDDSHYDEALAAMAGADVILFTLGGKYTSGSISTTGEGVDDVNINLPPCQDGLIRRAAALGIPMVGVHFDGRPVSSDVADAHLNAILEAWCPGETGARAVADVLLGAYNPAGRLPVCVALYAGQIPVFYNHPWNSAWHQGASIGFQDYASCPHTPRYFFGHGLSYTRFEYADLEIARGEAGPMDTVDIAFTLRNAGEADGDEVAQLYISDPYASMVRPVKELAGFRRIHLRAGEARRVTFSLRVDQMAFVDEDMNWKVEKGAYEAQVGASSEDIRLRGGYSVTESAIIDGRTRGFYAHVKVEAI